MLIMCKKLTPRAADAHDGWNSHPEQLMFILHGSLRDSTNDATLHVEQLMFMMHVRLGEDST